VQELKASFIGGTVKRLAEVEWKSLHGAYDVRESDKYDGIPETRIWP